MKRAVVLAHRGVAATDAADELVSRAGGRRLALEVALHHLGQHPPCPAGPGQSVAHAGADASLRLAITRLGHGSETAGFSASGLPHDDEGARRMVDTRLAH